MRNGSFLLMVFGGFSSCSDGPIVFLVYGSAFWWRIQSQEKLFTSWQVSKREQSAVVSFRDILPVKSRSLIKPYFLKFPPPPSGVKLGMKSLRLEPLRDSLEPTSRIHSLSLCLFFK